MLSNYKIYNLTFWFREINKNLPDNNMNSKKEIFFNFFFS
jgi:hypothetical protein